MRRAIARNYGEQLQLEKLQKYLDKSKTLETNRFQRSQMDTILQLCDTRGVNLKELCNEELVAAEERKSRCESNNSRPGSRPPLTSNTKPRENKEILMLVRKFSQSFISSASNCSAISRISAKSFLPEVQQILERKSQLERSRTWPQSRFCLKRESAFLSAFPAKCDKLSQKTAVGDGKSSSFTEGFAFKEDVVPEENKSELKPLHELLPPVQLPSLRLQKTPTPYKQKNTREKKTESTTEEVWKDLENCRYLRPYLKHKP